MEFWNCFYILTSQHIYQKILAGIKVSVNSKLGPLACGGAVLYRRTFYLSTVNQLQQVLINSQNHLLFHKRHHKREMPRLRYIHHCYRNNDLWATPQDHWGYIISRIIPMFGFVIKFKWFKKAISRAQNPTTKTFF